jgi:hypothetical protein
MQSAKAKLDDIEVRLDALERRSDVAFETMDRKLEIINELIRYLSTDRSSNDCPAVTRSHADLEENSEFVMMRQIQNGHDEGGQFDAPENANHSVIGAFTSGRVFAYPE